LLFELSGLFSALEESGCSVLGVLGLFRDLRLEVGQLEVQTALDAGLRIGDRQHAAGLVVGLQPNFEVRSDLCAQRFEDRENGDRNFYR